MYVLIDIEWVQENGTDTITQMAVNRVSETWDVTEDFCCLVRPEKHWDFDSEHMAYSGYSPDEFIAGVSEHDCLEQLERFIRTDDIICCWHSDTKKLLRQKYEDCLGARFPCKVVCLNRNIYAMADKRGIDATGMYEIAAALGVETPLPKHRSANDVFVLGRLLSALKYRQKARVRQPEPQRKELAKRERNADILSRVTYNYIFTPDSNVFHRATCKCMLNANDIRGCIYYDVAIKNRRPCKLCRPEKDPVQQPERQENEIIHAKLLGNTRVEISRKKIVGCCHNVIHPGKLTRKILEEHDCVGKQCHFFEKYADSTYWIAEENKKRQKAERKRKQQAQKAAAQKQENELERLKALFQSYADDAEYSMLIVRVEREASEKYRVFYVSEHPFADGNLFPFFLETIKHFFPRYRISLRHIRDVDGHFVTLEEYLSRK